MEGMEEMVGMCFCNVTKALIHYLFFDVKFTTKEVMVPTGKGDLDMVLMVMTVLSWFLLVQS
jgi:hypothetical protein